MLCMGVLVVCSLDLRQNFHVLDATNILASGKIEVPANLVDCYPTQNVKLTYINWSNGEGFNYFIESWAKNSSETRGN